MKNLFKSLLLVLPLLCIVQRTDAQPLPVRWDEFFPTGWEANNFTAERIIEIVNGGIVVAGTRRFESLTNPHNEVLIIRIDTDGDMIWDRSYGGLHTVYIRNELHEVTDTVITPWEQVANDMLQTPAGNFLVTGFRDTTSATADTYNELLIQEIAPNGEVVSDDLLQQSATTDYEGFSIAPAIGGGYVIAGTLKEEGYGQNDQMMLIRVVKDPDGHYRNHEFPWSVNSQLGIYTHPRWIRQLMSGYLVAGTCYSVNTKNDIFLQRTLADRTESWTKFFGGADEEEFGDAVIYDEHIFLTGSKKVPMGLPVNGVQSLIYQVYVVKMDFQGDTVWTRTYGGLSTNYGTAIDVVDNNLMIGVNHINPQMHSEIALLNVDAETGDSLWMHTYGNFYSAGIRTATRTSDFGYLLAGRASYTGTQDPRIYVMKFNNSSNTEGETLVRGELKLTIATDTPTKDVISITADKNTIYGVTVVIDSLVHPSVGDLEISLEHDGTEVILIDRPEHSGENFIHTGLADVCENSIQSGYAPYRGWFRPDNLLQPFLEHVPSGEWTLTITDHGVGGLKSTTGMLEGWTLNLLTEAGAGTSLRSLEELSGFGLEPVIPNPVWQEAMVRFRILESGHVKLTLYNSLGQRIGILADEEMAEGVHELRWVPGSHASGVCFIQLESGGMVSVRKAIIAK